MVLLAESPASPSAATSGPPRVGQVLGEVLVLDFLCSLHGIQEGSCLSFSPKAPS